MEKRDVGVQFDGNVNSDITPNVVHYENSESKQQNNSQQKGTATTVTHTEVKASQRASSGGSRREQTAAGEKSAAAAGKSQSPRSGRQPKGSQDPIGLYNRFGAFEDDSMEFVWGDASSSSPNTPSKRKSPNKPRKKISYP